MATLTIAQQIAQAQAMLNQTKAQGNTPFAGSSYASPSYKPTPTPAQPLSQPQLTQIGQQNQQATGVQNYRPPQTSTLSNAPISSTMPQNQSLGIAGGNVTPPLPTAPTAPVAPIPSPYTDTSSYETNYQNTLKPTDTENQLSAQQVALQDSYNKGTVQNEGALAPMSAITGDQQLIDKSFNLSSQTLTQRLALEQAKRQGAMDVSKFALERADVKNKTQADLAKEQAKLTEVSPGATLYNPQTKEGVFTAPEKSTPLTASQTEVRSIGGRELLIDSRTGETIKDLGASKTTGGSGTKPIVSAGLTTNQTAIGANLQVLNASKTAGAEADGVYADPSIYLQLYQKWVDQKGSPTDFFKYYPPNSFLNPANKWIANSIPGLSKVWTTPVKPKGTDALLNLFN
jgi:hypothetical protein